MDWIKLPRAADVWMKGVSGRLMGAHKHSLDLKIQGEKIQVRCMITKSDRTPFLLGRIDFFDQFDVIFDNKNQKIVLNRLT